MNIDGTARGPVDPDDPVDLGVPAADAPTPRPVRDGRSSPASDRRSRAPAPDAAAAATTTTSPQRPLERARILLDATNAFLVCENADAFAATVAGVMDAPFEPDKIVVSIVGPGGRLRVAGATGFDAGERARIDVALAQASSLARQVLDGEELWSNDAGRETFRTRMGEYGGRAGFSLPLASPTGIVGTCAGIYDAEREFDEVFRSEVRSLVAQAGLAISLLTSRDEARSAAAASRRHQEASHAMLGVAGTLAMVTDPDTIPALLVDAVRTASGSGSATVARLTPDGGAFVAAASSGLSPEVAALLHGRLLPVAAGGAMGELIAGRPAISQPTSSALHEQTRLGVSYLAPVMTAGRVWGFIGLSDPPPTTDADAVLDLVVGFASVAATAIERAEAVAEVERQRHRSDTLPELSAGLSSARDGTDVARLVTAFIRRASGASFAMVARRASDGPRFTTVATDGLTLDQVTKIDAALERTDRPSLTDLLGGGITQRHGESAVGTGLGIAEAMGAPIVVDGRTVGFIAIAAPAGEAAGTANWQELLVAFAALTATAWARADAVHALAVQRDALASEVEEQTRSLRTVVDELRQASDAKTDFLANVSHELRTPLTAILGFSELLAGAVDGPVNESQARDLETIRSSSRHLLELIDDLIDIASIEGRRIQLQLVDVDALEIVRDAIETIGPLADAKGVRLVEAPPAAGRADRAIVSADRGRLREIVLNVLSNAVKFTPAGGRVDVSVTVTEAMDVAAATDAPEADTTHAPANRPIGNLAAAPGVAIVVRDTGSGIAPGDQERIFEKFVRVGPVAIPGTGLGLPISRELARLQDGDLTVDSAVGHGSAFTIHLRRADG